MIWWDLATRRLIPSGGGQKEGTHERVKPRRRYPTDWHIEEYSSESLVLKHERPSNSRRTLLRGRAKDLPEEWIRGKVCAGGSIHDYYPPSPEKMMGYKAETSRTAQPIDAGRNPA